MLATQFLNVVLEENDSGIRRNKHDLDNDDEPSEESNNNTIYDIISQLDIKSQLAKILLAECTIEPSKIAKKREKPILSFEANVTPIYNVPTKKQQASEEIYSVPPKKPKPNDEMSILNSVEAVYSEGEENDISDDSTAMLPCPVCNRVFSRNCSLALHMKSHELPSEEPFRRYQCHFCPKSFSQKPILKKHLAECAIQKGYKPTFLNDRQTDGPVQPQRRYECQFCHRSYTQKSVLKKHLVVHTGERERCNICGAGFSQRSSLVRHAKRIHGGMLTHAISGSGSATPSSVNTPPGNGVLSTPVSQVLTKVHNTPILTTALSGVTHPTLGTPLIVGIPLNQLAAGKFAGTQFSAASLFNRSAGVPPVQRFQKAVPAAIPINSAVAAALAAGGNQNLARLAKVPLKPPSDPVLIATLNRNLLSAPKSPDSTAEKTDLSEGVPPAD